MNLAPARRSLSASSARNAPCARVSKDSARATIRPGASCTTAALEMLHFLDTNILIYSISDKPAEAAKRSCAEALLARDDGALSVQVLQEFYVQATRPTRPGRLAHGVAA